MYIFGCSFSHRSLPLTCLYNFLMFSCQWYFKTLPHYSFSFSLIFCGYTYSMLGYRELGNSCSFSHNFVIFCIYSVHISLEVKLKNLVWDWRQSTVTIKKKIIRTSCTEAHHVSFYPINSWNHSGYCSLCTWYKCLL